MSKYAKKQRHGVLLLMPPRGRRPPLLRAAPLLRPIVTVRLEGLLHTLAISSVCAGRPEAVVHRRSLPTGLPIGTIRPRHRQQPALGSLLSRRSSVTARLGRRYRTALAGAQPEATLRKTKGKRATRPKRVILDLILLFILHLTLPFPIPRSSWLRCVVLKAKHKTKTPNPRPFQPYGHASRPITSPDAPTLPHR